MNTKGSAFLARRELVVGEIGEARWEAFLKDFASLQPIFAQPILATTKIPIEAFLALNDALVAAFYGGDLQTHWRFGQASAEWAFANGPYKKYFRSGGFKGFVESGPMIWKAYYDAGELIATWSDAPACADVRIVGLPLKHVHFEYNVMGFLRRGLELTGGSVQNMRALQGVGTGDTDIHYQFDVLAISPGEVA